MTPDELRTLDAEIHLKVFGLGSTFDCGDLWGHDEADDWGDESDPVPHYSTDIAAAWLVVEKLYETGIRLDLYRMTGHRTDWCCWFDRHGGYGDTAPLAVCRAALVAVSEHANHPP